jgi:hypothetical protein
MPYTDLLRLTVLLAGGEATALATISVLSVQRHHDALSLPIGAAWWLIAIIVGLELGRPARASDGVRDALASAQTATALPQESDSRIALGRLWPIAATAVAAGVLGIFFPGVSIIGGGFALLVALAWRTREAAVLGVEERDGVRFYVEPTSALRPVKLIRTPGLTRDRAPAGHPPPPG